MLLPPGLFSSIPLYSYGIDPGHRVCSHTHFRLKFLLIDALVDNGYFRHGVCGQSFFKGTVQDEHFALVFFIRHVIVDIGKAPCAAVFPAYLPDAVLMNTADRDSLLRRFRDTVNGFSVFFLDNGIFISCIPDKFKLCGF